MQLKVRQRATDHAVGDTRPNHRPDGGYSQQVYGMGEDKTTSSSCGSDKGGPRPGVYRVFMTAVTYMHVTYMYAVSADDCVGKKVLSAVFQ